MSQPFGPRPAGIGWRLECDQDMLIEEVGKRTMTDIVEQARDPEGLDHDAFGGNPITARGQGGSKAGIEAAGPGPGLVHHTQAVGEPAVFGRGEDPAGTLELADPTEALQPGRVQQILLGAGLGGQPEGGRVGRLEPLRQLDVAVDRVADEVGGRERVAAHGRRVSGPRWWRT